MTENRKPLLGRLSSVLRRRSSVVRPPSSFHFRVCEMPEGRYRLQLQNPDGYAYLVGDTHVLLQEAIEIGRFLAQKTGLPFKEETLR